MSHSTSLRHCLRLISQLNVGDDIEIEERDDEEVTVVDGQRVAPMGVDVFNPAFDITSADLVTAIITEAGIVYPPFKKNLAKLKSV